VKILLLTFRILNKRIVIFGIRQLIEAEQNWQLVSKLLRFVTAVVRFARSYIDSLSRRFEPVCPGASGTIRPLRLTSLGDATLLLLLYLEQQGAVNVRQDTSESDGGTDKRVEFLITSDGEL